jgi:hypothetical protein
MGLPYAVKGSKLTETIIDSCRGIHLLQSRELNQECYAGTDIGTKIHTIISTLDENGLPKILLAKEVNSWDELKYVHKNFNIVAHVIDMNPDKDEAVAFQDENEYVYLAYFKNALETSSELFESPNDEDIIAVHRTLIMSTCIDMFHKRKLVLPTDIKTIRDFYDHLTSVIKALKQDNNNNWLAYFPKVNKPDHYFFALVYNLIATQVKPRPSIFRMVKTILS